MTQPTMDELRALVGAHRDKTHWSRRYGAEPGTGPVGKMCRDCNFLRSTDPQGRGKHPKCGKTKYTAGDATTIKVRTPACSLFEQFKPRGQHD